MILVDTPRWPAHGTIYGHLVSDEDLWELHRFARELGLDPRAFDHDHYDLPQRLWQPAQQLGALLVDERELVRRLRTSGPRVLPADHAPRRRRARARVAAVARELFSAWGASPQVVEAELEAMVAAMSGQGRRYHDLRHVDEMVAHLCFLARQGGLEESPAAERLAALFHDVVYQGVAGQDERDSAAWAEASLVRLGAPQAVVREVERLVLLTAHHCPEAGDPSGARVSDADMAILGSVAGRYHVSVRDIRVEYGALDDEQWRAGRGEVLRSFLAGAGIFHSPAGRGRWEERARANVTDELEHLDEPWGLVTLTPRDGLGR